MAQSSQRDRYAGAGGNFKEWRNLPLLSLLFQISPSLGQFDMFSLAGYSDMKSKLVTSLCYDDDKPSLR
jgi:hypothetical protein